METLQVDKKVTCTQPQVIRDLKIYSVPQKPYDSARNQPPNTNYKIYGAKKLPTIRVRMKDSEAAGEIVINKNDFNSDIHELVE